MLWMVSILFAHCSDISVWQLQRSIVKYTCNTMPNVSPICSCSLTITADTVHKLDFIKDSKPNSADQTFPQQGLVIVSGWPALANRQSQHSQPLQPYWNYRDFSLHFFSLFLFHFYICHLALSIFVPFMTIFYVIKKLYVFS